MHNKNKDETFMCGVDEKNLYFTERGKVYTGKKNVTKKVLNC